MCIRDRHMTGSADGREKLDHWQTYSSAQRTVITQLINTAITVNLLINFLNWKFSLIVRNGCPAKIQYQKHKCVCVCVCVYVCVCF